MKKPKVLFFTKTTWEEPPRLRHQVVRLLKDMGYDIVFFERPSLNVWLSIRKEEGITFVRHFELIHHRLRFFDFLVKINVGVYKFFIKKAIKKLKIGNEPVLNFSYDYYFLKDFFNTNITTVIDDDFVNKLKDGLVKKNTELQLAKTARNSTYNLAVSYPLRNQLEQFVEKAYLFFPWAEQIYEKPKTDKKRDVVLFFGYINYRIDWPLVLDIIRKGIKFRFIGPIEKSVNLKYLEEAQSSPNVEFLSAMNINNIDFSDICCSILPWDTSFEGIQAITINNKCFNLLSRGIPQLYTDLPYLIEADNQVIGRCRTAKEFMESIKYYSDNFEDCQQPIIDFLEMHYPKKRALELRYYLTNEK